VEIRHEVPDTFIKAARRLKLEPDHLAKVVCEDFARNVPSRLVIISSLACSSENVSELVQNISRLASG
jgi:hypothetical protein